MCLSIGAMVPDLEIFPMMPFSSSPIYARGPMHSLLGALTFDIIVVLIFALLVIPPIGRWFKRNTKHNWHLFAGVDVTLAPTNIAWALASAGIGTLSHITMDVFTHSFNPIFWPYVHNNVSWMLFGDKPMASLIVAIPLLVIILTMLLLYWTKADGRKRA